MVFVFYANSVGEEAKPQVAKIQQDTIATQKSSVTSGEKIFQVYLNRLAIRELFYTEQTKNNMNQKLFCIGDTFHLNRKYNYDSNGNVAITDTTTTTNTDKTAPTYIYDTKESRDAIGRTWSLEGTIKSSTGETFHLNRKYHYDSNGNAVVTDTMTTTHADKTAPTYIYDTNESRDAIGRTWSLGGTIKSSTGETFHLNRKYNYGNDGNIVVTDMMTTTHTDKTALTYKFDFTESFNAIGQLSGFEGKIIDSKGQLTKINRKSATSVDNGK